MNKPLPRLRSVHVRLNEGEYAWLAEHGAVKGVKPATHLRMLLCEKMRNSLDAGAGHVANHPEDDRHEGYV